jgi:hypothetical protein
MGRPSHSYSRKIMKYNFPPQEWNEQQEVMKYNFPATGVGGPAVLARLAQEHFAKVTAHGKFMREL